MIRRQEGYKLKNIEGIYSLLPFGQKVADQKKGITLNETGVFLWSVLEEPAAEEELVSRTAEYYGITQKEDLEQLEGDIREFTEQLLNLGILRREFQGLLPDAARKCLARTERAGKKCAGMEIAGMEIAGMRIGLSGPEGLIPEQFRPFMIPVPEPDMCEDSDMYNGMHKGVPEKWDQLIEFAEKLPESRQNGRVLLRNEELVISEWKEGYILLFPTMKSVYEAYMTEDGSHVRIYCRHPFGEEEKEQLFHAVRICYLYLAQRKGFYALHSASILYKGKAWLFSGHSGMGKSTHTRMWHEQLGTPYLNGDLNLLGRKDGKIMVRGIPWCGTSGIYTTEDYELGGIVLLGRDTEDHVEPLTMYEKILRVMQRMISPVWKEDLLEKNLKFAEELAGEIPVLHLLCTKEISAVETVQKEIDRLIKGDGTIKDGQYEEIK